MTLARPITFWIAMLAGIIAVIVLLREILLPLVAGMVVAYLLDPLVRYALAQYYASRLYAGGAEPNAVAGATSTKVGHKPDDSIPAALPGPATSTQRDRSSG